MLSTVTLNKFVTNESQISFGKANKTKEKKLKDKERKKELQQRKEDRRILKNILEEKAHASFFYVNDLHGNFTNLAPITVAADEFRSSKKDKDAFVMAGGDIKSGINNKKNLFHLLWMNLTGFDFCAIGNHEFDCGISNFAKQLDHLDNKSISLLKKPFKTKFIATNMCLNENNPLLRHFKTSTAIFNDTPQNVSNKKSTETKKILKSAIIEKNGHKYGIIGTIPSNIKDLIPEKDSKFIYATRGSDQVCRTIQSEVDKLIKEHKVNKIILESHAGLAVDQEIAKNTKGVDVILGAHSHDLLKNLVPNYNLVNSAAHEPVVIVQAKKNGQYYGVLDVDFDERGVIDKEKLNNQIYETSNIKPDTEIRAEKFNQVNKLLDKCIGPEETLGNLSEDYIGVNSTGQENPLSSFAADSILIKAQNEGIKADAVVSISNSNQFKKFFKAGPITDRDLNNVLPFDEDLYMVKLKGSQLTKILEIGLNSLYKPNKADKRPNPKPGLIQGNLFYDANINEGIQNLHLLDTDKNPVKVDPNKEYNTIFNNYFIYSLKMAQNDDNNIRKFIKNDLLPLLTDKSRTTLKFTELTAIKENIKQLKGKPFKIKEDGRINFNNSELKLTY